MVVKHIILLTFLLCFAHSAKVFDISSAFKTFTCMKSLGYEHAILRAYLSYGAIDTVAPENIRLSN